MNNFYERRHQPFVPNSDHRLLLESKLVLRNPSHFKNCTISFYKNGAHSKSEGDERRNCGRFTITAISPLVIELFHDLLRLLVMIAYL